MARSLSMSRPRRDFSRCMFAICRRLDDDGSLLRLHSDIHERHTGRCVFERVHKRGYIFRNARPAAITASKYRNPDMDQAARRCPVRCRHSSG